MKALLLTLPMLLPVTMISFTVAEETTELPLQIVKPAAESVPVGGYRVFDQSYFSGKYTTLADFMQSVNGIQVNQSGAIGDPVLVSVQGASSGQTKLYIDGVLANTGQFGNYDLNSIPIEHIKQVEVYTDQADLELGSAIGGVINIITQGHDNQQNKVSASVGSYETYTANLSIAAGKDSTVELSHEQSANNYEVEVPSPAGNSQNRNDKQNLNNAEYQKTTLSVIQGFRWATLVARYQDERKNFPDYQRNSEQQKASLETQTSSLNLKGNFSTTPLGSYEVNHKWKMAYRYVDETYIDESSIIGLGIDNNRYYTDKYQLDWSSRLSNHSIKSGVYISHSEENYRSRYLDDPDSRQCITPGGDCDQYANQKNLVLKLSAGWTSENYDTSANIITGLDQVKNLNRAQTDQFDRSTSSDTYDNYLINLSHSTLWGDFSLSYKDAVRVPTLYELFGDRGLLLNNVDLNPEEAKTISAAYRNQTPYGNFHFTIFHRNLNNAIVPVYDSRGIGRYENTSKAELDGIEWHWSKQHEVAHIHFSGSHYDSQTFSDNVKSFDNKKLSGIYHNNFLAAISKRWDKHNLRLSYQLADDLYIDRSNLVEADTKSSIDIIYQFTFNQGSIAASVRNITNNQYQDFSNRPARGRWITLYANYSF